MIYVSVTTGIEDDEFTEFWIPEENEVKLLRALNDLVLYLP